MFNLIKKNLKEIPIEYLLHLVHCIKPNPGAAYIPEEKLTLLHKMILQSQLSALHILGEMLQLSIRREKDYI